MPHRHDSADPRRDYIDAALFAGINAGSPECSSSSSPFLVHPRIAFHRARISEGSRQISSTRARRCTCSAASTTRCRCSSDRYAGVYDSYIGFLEQRAVSLSTSRRASRRAGARCRNTSRLWMRSGILEDPILHQEPTSAMPLHPADVELPGAGLGQLRRMR